MPKCGFSKVARIRLFLSFSQEDVDFAANDKQNLIQMGAKSTFGVRLKKVSLLVSRQVM